MVADADIILKFEIAPDRFPEGEIAANALAAWVDLLRTAAAIVEPGLPVRVELVGVAHGSQTFKFALKRGERFASDLKDGMDDYPLLSQALITIGGLVTSTAIIVGITNALTSDPRIPADQMAVFEEMKVEMQESNDLQRQQMRFYGILQDEPAYERIDVLRPDMSVAYSIPRAEFAPRSGLWTEQPAFKAVTEPRTATWDVVLIKPVLVPLERRWRFARDGLEFSALMQDPNILQAIHDRTLPMQIAEGEMMKVEIEYRELYDGKNWVPVSGSHRIKRVLHPLPPLSAGPLFAPD